MEECANILSNLFKFITEQAIGLCFSYLVLLCNLPAGMKQIQSKHSLVILDALIAGERKIFKFTLLPHKREWLLCFLGYRIVKRSFNLGYQIVRPRTGESARAVQAVLIDLDQGS